MLGVDVARFGDDASVIFPRQGLVAFAPQHFRNLDGNQGAGAVARKWTDWDADAVFVDDTGGCGGELDRWPAPARPPADRHRLRQPRHRSALRQQAGRDVLRRRALDPHGRPAAAPTAAELIAALSQTTYSFKGDQLLLEDKEQLKQRLGFSPDEADAFALTFAQPVSRRDSGKGGLAHDYDPLEQV